MFSVSTVLLCFLCDMYVYMYVCTVRSHTLYEMVMPHTHELMISDDCVKLWSHKVTIRREESTPEAKRPKASHHRHQPVPPPPAAPAGASTTVAVRIDSATHQTTYQTTLLTWEKWLGGLQAKRQAEKKTHPRSKNATAASGENRRRVSIREGLRSC